MWRQHGISLKLLGFVVVVACSDASPTTTGVAQSPTETTAATPATGELVEPECVEGGLCAAGFNLNGAFYALSCVGLRDSAVTGEEVGRGNVYGEDVTANRVEGYPPTLIVAVSIDGGMCSEEDPNQRPTAWSMAFSEDIEQAPVLGAVCEVGELSEAQWLANGCHLDEELVTCGYGPGFPAEVLDDLSMYPEVSPTFGADVAALLGNDSPEDLAGWHVIVEEQGSDGELIQLLLREAPDSGEIQYVLDGSHEVFDSPRRCDPQPVG